jgi:hypothetical protein
MHPGKEWMAKRRKKTPDNAAMQAGAALLQRGASGWKDNSSP